MHFGLEFGMFLEEAPFYYCSSLEKCGLISIGNSKPLSIFCANQSSYWIAALV